MKDVFNKWNNRPVVYASIALLALLAIATPVVANNLETVPTGTVTAGRLNVREGPGVGFLPIATVDYGSEVELLGRTGESAWLNVRVKSGVKGWVSSLYINSSVPFSTLPVLVDRAEAYAYISTGRLNMRTGPGVEYPIITTLTHYDTVGVIGRSRSGGWLYIHAFGTYKGWVNAGYVVCFASIQSLPVVEP